MAKLTIQQATVDDAATIARLHVRGWQWGYRGILPKDFLASLSAEAREPKWRAQLEQASPACTWIAIEDDVPVAFVTYGPARDSDLSPSTGSAEIYAIYEEEAVAGTGIGRALMAHAMKELRSRGYELAVLWVLEANSRARRFYEIGGWERDGGARVEPAPEGERREVRYRKLLTQP
jgi:GNAT superfamily N-acetyltransferase